MHAEIRSWRRSYESGLRKNWKDGTFKLRWEPASLSLSNEWFLFDIPDSVYRVKRVLCLKSVALAASYG